MLYPLDFAADLCSIEVIDKRTLNKFQKNEDPVDCLLKAVQAYIEVHKNYDPKVFQQILDIFKMYTLQKGQYILMCLCVLCMMCLSL